MTKMPKYVAENEAIEGRRILCTFERRPSYGIERENQRQQITITGNPATATMSLVWEYKHS
jgi:hypothetical protein